jgi:hypothetical protein
MASTFAFVVNQWTRLCICRCPNVSSLQRLFFFYNGSERSTTVTSDRLGARDKAAMKTTLLALLRLVLLDFTMVTC